ncbi:MAG: S8 family serine peptidase, partial [Bacteroidales bacterium]|nr:S8 family serine peptidase [Bacteroidales bacterium]
HVPVDTSTVCPAHLDNAIVVGALNKDNSIAYFSNYGESVDVAAPGVNIYSSYLNGEYKEMSGTSMATPFISACCAMFKLAYPSYSPKEIETLIKNYCIDLGKSGRDDYYGNGYINMYNAIPDCTVKYITNGGNTISDVKIKNSDEVKLPEPTKSFTVTLNANGGKVSTSSYRRECELEGWYNNSALGGTRFNPGGSYTIISDETMYAKWDNPTLGAVENPTRTDATFLGWYSAQSGGTKYTSLTSITANTTLYAHWSVKKNGTITTSKAIDNRQLTISWSSSGYRYVPSTGAAVLCTGTGTSYSGEYIPTQGTWTKDTGLTSGGAVFEISNLSSIRSYIKSLNNGTLT